MLDSILVYALLFVFEAVLPMEMDLSVGAQPGASQQGAELIVTAEGSIAERYYLVAEGRGEGYVRDSDGNRLFAFEALRRYAHLYAVFPSEAELKPSIVDLWPVLNGFTDPRGGAAQVLRGAQHPEAGELGEIGVQYIGSEYYLELKEHGKVLIVRTGSTSE